MERKTLAGWLAIIGVSLSPVLLWLLFGPGVSDLVGYGNLTHSIGEMMGLVAMVMFALTFVLSTRIKAIENIFGGLDKVYMVHGILGGSAMILILFHPIFLVLRFIPGNISTAAKYLLPSPFWSVDFGMLALVGFVILIYITLFSKMKYHKWKFTHEFMGLVFMFAVAHIFLIRDVSHDYIFHGYYYYATAVSLLGLSAFAYSLFIKNRLFKNAVYKIKRIENSKDNFEIVMTPEHKPISYKSGQFVFVRFYNEKLGREAHPFSIASKTNSKELKIVVRKLGDYTSKLEHLKSGDKVSIEGPYGRFNYERLKGKDQVWIAGGIGIVPFLGMAEELADLPELKEHVTLYYSVNVDSDFVGTGMLENIALRVPNFKMIKWISKYRGYLSGKDIMKNINFKDTEFFLCGPSGFKESITKGLIEAGVSKDNIKEEVFDFR